MKAARKSLSCNFSKQVLNQIFFRAGEVCWNKGTSIIISCTTDKRKAPAPKSFLLDTLKTAFQMRNLTQRWKSFNFQSKGRGDLPSLLTDCTPAKKWIAHLSLLWFCQNIQLFWSEPKTTTMKTNLGIKIFW